MTKPTRGEVETFIAVLPKLSVQMIEEDWVLALAKAYLAQEEELEEKDNDIKFLDKEIKRMKLEHEAILDGQRERFRQDKDQIEAENQALKAKLLILEA